MTNEITNDARDLLEKFFSKESKLSQEDFSKRELVFLDELVEKRVLKKNKKNEYLVTKKALDLLEDLAKERANIYTEEYRVTVEDLVKKHSSFIISTVVQGKPVFEKFVKSIENFSKRNKAMKIVVPCEDVVSRGRKAKYLEIAPELSNFYVAFKDLNITDELMISGIKVSAKQVLPLSGLDRIATSVGKSIIVGSPKRFLKYVPNLNDSKHLLLATPGALTINNYDNERYMSQRTSAIAEKDHAFSAVVVELDSDGDYHLRHVTAGSDGSFIDLGVRYMPNGKVEGVSGTSMVMGDSHVGYINEDFHRKAMDLADLLDLKTLILHDIFNGTSITHHDQNKHLTKVMKANCGLHSLDEELRAVKEHLELMKRHARSIKIVDSNHDNHLNRYLEEYRFKYDPINGKTALELASRLLEGDSPLRYAVEDKLGMDGANIRWLSKNESCKEHGVEVGVHGHLGANGAKGSLSTYDRCIGDCVTAHTHSASIIRNTYCVGTSTVSRMGYNEGLSNWTNSCCLIYPNGTKQLVTFTKKTDGTFEYKGRR